MVSFKDTVSFKDKDMVLHKDNNVNDNENFEIIRCIIAD